MLVSCSRLEFSLIGLVRQHLETLETSVLKLFTVANLRYQLTFIHVINSVDKPNYQPFYQLTVVGWEGGGCRCIVALTLTLIPSVIVRCMHDGR